MAVVPTNIVTLIVLTDELVDNKFSHITFLIGNYTMKEKVSVMILDKNEEVFFEIFENEIEVVGKHKGFK